MTKENLRVYNNLLQEKEMLSRQLKKYDHGKNIDNYLQTTERISSLNKDINILTEKNTQSNNLSKNYHGFLASMGF